MIKARFLIHQHFPVFGIIKKIENVISGNPHPSKRQNEVINDKNDL